MAVTASNSHKLFCADSSLAIARGKREHAFYDGVVPTNEINMIESPVLRKLKRSNGGSINWSSQRGKFYPVMNAVNSSEKHLKFLDSYLEKLHGNAKNPSIESFHQKTNSPQRNEQHKVGNSLRSLENYLRKVRNDLRTSISTSTKKDLQRERDGSLQNYMELRFEDAEGKQKSEDEVSDFYIIGILASINIAVFLFELATPVQNSSSVELLSLPMVFGAKINTLILMGEWWRLVTPMFLHSGFFHISLGCCVLFTFGLQVSQEYGSFTFLLIYLLGGISGNLISYLHMPDPTVGGTGPVFAIIGAWLIYQMQNRDLIPKDSFDKMFQNAIIVTSLSCILSNFGPIDDWAHFAAACTGIAYGYATCPTLQVKGISSEAGRQKRVTLVKHYADPCKSLAFFSLFLLLLCSLLFVIEPPIDLTG